MTKVHYSDGQKSITDKLIERLRDGKNETNEMIMRHLRRTDNESPEIPRILERYPRAEELARQLTNEYCPHALYSSVVLHCHGVQ